MYKCQVLKFFWLFFFFSDFVWQMHSVDHFIRTELGLCLHLVSRFSSELNFWNHLHIVLMLTMLLPNTKLVLNFAFGALWPLLKLTLFNCYNFLEATDNILWKQLPENKIAKTLIRNKHLILNYGKTGYHK